MKFSKFPKEIKKVVQERTEQQGNVFKVAAFDTSIIIGRIDNGFTWDNTPEGSVFWHRVLVNENFDLFWERFPKETKTQPDLPSPPDPVLFHPPFREGDIVKCVKNTFNQNTECIGKYFCLTALNAKELNSDKTTILNTYPSGERNEFEVNYSADLLIISNRSETILNNNNNLQHDRTHIQTASSTDSRSDCSIQGTIYSKSGFPQIRCGY